MSIPLAAPIKMIVKRTDNICIHTFISSYMDDHLANATHIIEGKRTLVIVDGQFIVPYAKLFKAYADSLKKPIERIYLSHRHPDHWFGLGAAFETENIYALPDTIDFLKCHGQDSINEHLSKLGEEFTPEKFVLPKNIAIPGSDEIDGIKYVFDQVIDTEVDFLLTIKLPDFRVHFAQDLIYSGTHLYLYKTSPDRPTKAIENWITVLEDMVMSDYELFMPGHGLPADKKEVALNIEYLASAKQAIEEGLGKIKFKNFMLQRYPERKCPAIFDIYLPRFFDNANTH